jgi:hypothetical protein
MKTSLCLALIALLSGCIPVCIRGTSVTEADSRHRAAAAMSPPAIGQSGYPGDPAVPDRPGRAASA